MPEYVLVQRWVDCTSKYGVGYKLTSGVYGALFNDKSSAIMSGGLYFEQQAANSDGISKA
jgi:hypothetical protein